MQTYEIEIPPFVEDKIKEQAYFIAQDKPVAALEWYERIFEKISTLESLPNRCPLAPESQFFEFEIRHLLVGEYRILFRIKDSIVVILEFKGGSQNKPE